MSIDWKIIERSAAVITILHTIVAIGWAIIGELPLKEALFLFIYFLCITFGSLFLTFISFLWGPVALVGLIPNEIPKDLLHYFIIAEKFTGRFAHILSAMLWWLLIGLFILFGDLIPRKKWLENLYAYILIFIFCCYILISFVLFFIDSYKSYQLNDFGIAIVFGFFGIIYMIIEWLRRLTCKAIKHFTNKKSS